MRHNQSEIEYSLLINENDEKKTDTRIMIDVFADLRRLNMLGYQFLYEHLCR